MAEIFNKTSNTLVTGTADADRVVNGGYQGGNYYSASYVTIESGAGNDTIYDYDGDHSLIKTGAGNDSIYDSDGDYITVDAGDGDDTVGGNYWYSSINGGAGNDSIYLRYVYDSTIRAGKGNDTIGYPSTSSKYYGDNERTIYQYANGDGVDDIYRFNSYDRVQLLEGAEVKSVKKVGDDIVIGMSSNGSINLKNYASAKIPIVRFIDSNGETDSSYIVQGNNISTIDVKVIENYGDSVTGTAQNDVIEVVNKNGYNTTINTGLGNDTVLANRNYSNVYTYNSGDGNDVILTNGNFNGTLNLESGSVTGHTINSNGDEVLKIGTGSITLKNMYNWGASNNFYVRTKQTDGSYKVDYYRYGEVYNYLNSSDVVDNKIQGTSRNDYIDYYGENITINGDAGNDYIYSYYSNASNTIIGGKGDDTYCSSGYKNGSYDKNIFIYANGDGNDYIDSYGDLTVKLTNGAKVDDIYYKNGINFKIGSGSLRFYTWDRNITYSSGTDEITVRRNGSSLENGSVIYGSTSDDFIYNSNYKHWSETVASGSSYRWIYHNTTDTIIAGAGNDKIYLEGGYYSRKEYSHVVQYNAGDGKDTVYGYESYNAVIQFSDTTLNKLSLNGNDVVINDSITLKDSKDKVINIQEGNGEVKSFAFLDDNSTINAIYTGTSYETIKGTSGDDYIINDSYRSTVDAGAGNDTIFDNTEESSINAGAGNDVINAGDGWSFYSTFKAGLGNDTINLNGDHYRTTIQYKNGDGNDIVTHKRDDAFNNVIFALDNGTSLDSITKSGNDYVMKIGSGSITLKDIAPTYTTVTKIRVKTNNSATTYIDGKAFNTKRVTKNGSTTGTSNVDYIYGNYYNATVNVNAGDGDDFIESTNRYMNINGGNGNDTIISNGWSGSYENATINGGAGDDSIQLAVAGYYYDDYGYEEDEQANAQVNGGEGNDVIEIKQTTTTVKGYWDEGYDVYDQWYEEWNSGSYTFINGENVTVNAGTGNDTIRAKLFYMPQETLKTYEYDRDEGYDEDIYGYTSKTIKSEFNQTTNTYTSTATYRYEDGSTKVSTLKKSLLYNRLIQYKSGDGNDVVEDYHGEQKLTIDGAVKTFGDTIQVDGEYSTLTSGNDVIVKVGEGSITLKNARGQKLNIVGTQIEDESSESQATDKVTITNKDKSPYTATSMVGTIDGSARTTKITINANDYSNSIVGGSGIDIINAKAGNDTVISGKGNDQITGEAGDDYLDGGEGNDKLNGGADYDTLIGNAGNDTLQGEAGDDYLDGGEGIDKLYGGDGNDTLISGAGNDALEGEAGDDYLNGDVGNDKLNGGAGNDTLIGGAGNDTFTNGDGDDVIVYADGDGADVITDYSLTNDKIKLTSGSISKVTTSKTNVTLTIGKGSIKFNDKAGQRINIVDNNDNVIFSQMVGAKAISVSNEDYATVDAAIDSTVVSIDSSARTNDLTLTANAKANVIQLGSGNTTLTTGKGKDTIIYGGGNNLITDYTVAQDVLKFNAEIDDAVESGNDVIFTLGTGKVTVEGAAKKKITIIDKDNNKSSLIYGAADVTLSNSDGTYFKAMPSINSIDASKRTKAIEIVGNSKSNTIVSGKGADTLTGGTGSDTFVYTTGYGKDVITDYSATEGDVIKLGAKTSISNAQINGSDYIFTIGKGNITVKNGASQTITFIDDYDNEIIYRKRQSAFEEILPVNEISVDYKIEDDYINQQKNIPLTTNKSDDK